MQPILFWTVGAFSLVAGLAAIGLRRPLQCIQGLVALMITNSILLFMLSATLLAIELLVVSLGAAMLVWIVLVRPGRMKLGAPGRARLNITKLLAFFMALLLLAVLWWTLSSSTDPLESYPHRFYPRGELGAWVAVFLTGVAVVTSALVVILRRRENQEGESR